VRVVLILIFFKLHIPTGYCVISSQKIIIITVGDIDKIKNNIIYYEFVENNPTINYIHAASHYTHNICGAVRRRFKILREYNIILLSTYIRMIYYCFVLYGAQCHCPFTYYNTYSECTAAVWLIYILARIYILIKPIRLRNRILCVARGRRR